MADSPSLEETAADLELATELLPRMPESERELRNFRWAVAQAIGEARRDGAAVQLADLAEELRGRADEAVIGPGFNSLEEELAVIQLSAQRSTDADSHSNDDEGVA